MKVMLDAGHGGKDSGATGSGLKEKDIALSVTLKIGDILKAHNIDVTYTRTTDVFVELHERANMANKASTDAFVSIHCNAFKNADAQGVEVYHYPTSKQGFELSKSIIDGIVADKLYTKNRGVKMNNFAVLRLTHMPASLVELSFITNTEDANILVTKQDELAESVAKGILAHLKIDYKENKVEDPYDAAVKVLVDHGLIGTLSAWEDASKIKPASARAIIIKFADYITLKR